MVKTVRIDFRSGEAAQISDLNIYYYKIETAEQTYFYDMEQAYTPTLPVIGSFSEKQLWIEISDEDAEAKLQKLKETGEKKYHNTDHGMWLDVITKSSSDKEIKRHREVLTTRNKKSECK